MDDLDTSHSLGLGLTERRGLDLPDLDVSFVTRAYLFRHLNFSFIHRRKHLLPPHLALLLPFNESPARERQAFMNPLVPAEVQAQQHHTARHFMLVAKACSALMEPLR